MGGTKGMVLGIVLAALVSPLHAPQLLAFPYKTQTDIGTVWSERELDAQILTEMVSEVRSRMATTPLAQPDEQRSIFITDGGWRWLYTANIARDAFAIARPFTGNIIINRTDPESGVISTGRSIGGKRALAGVVAHEFTHELIWRRYGELNALRFPTWKIEGYCDYVAGETTLNASQVAELRKSGTDHPAILYFEGRERVAAILMANGGSVDALFEGN